MYIVSDQSETSDPRSLAPQLSFHPTRTFLVSPHHHYSKQLQVYETTQLVPAQGDAKSLAKVALSETVAQMTDACMSVDCKYFTSQRNQVHLEPKREHFAEWKANFMWRGSTTLDFEKGLNSTVDGGGGVGAGKLQMKPANLFGRSQVFSHAGTVFAWEPTTSWTPNRYSLTRTDTAGQPPSTVATTYQSTRLSGLGFTEKLVGMLVLDDRQLDWKIAVLTYLVMLRKLMDRKTLELEIF